jgi:hypothetical protein
MQLAPPSPTYDVTDQVALRSEILKADRLNRKLSQDIEAGGRNPRLILTDAADGSRYLVSVSNGALVITAL